MKWLSLSKSLFILTFVCFLITYMTMCKKHQETCEAEMRRNASIRAAVAVERNWCGKPNATDLSFCGWFIPTISIFCWFWEWFMILVLPDETLWTLQGPSAVRRSLSGSSALYKQAAGAAGQDWPHQAEWQGYDGLHKRMGAYGH